MKMVWVRGGGGGGGAETSTSNNLYVTPDLLSKLQLNLGGGDRPSHPPASYTYVDNGLCYFNNNRPFPISEVYCVCNSTSPFAEWLLYLLTEGSIHVHYTASGGNNAGIWVFGTCPSG